VVIFEVKMIKIREISVFFPAYNEEKNIRETVLEAKKILERIAEKWEIIVVNDGSKDKTGQISENLAKKEPRIKVFTHSPNRGYGGALKSGFAKAKYEWVAFTDADGQFDFSEITKFIKKIKEAELVLGYRLTRADSFLRKLFTWGWATLAKILLGLEARDYSCGFKLIKKEVYQKVQPLVGEEKVTQIELLVKAKKAGFTFAEVGVHHYPRKKGQQTGTDFKVISKSLIDLIKLWQRLRTTN